MKHTVDFYLTTIIQNSSKLDNLANFCLTPLRDFLCLNGRTVRIFKLNDEGQAPTEIYAQKTHKTTLFKILDYCAKFVFFIPLTALGIIFKASAQFDKDVETKNKTLSVFMQTQAAEKAAEQAAKRAVEKEISLRDSNLLALFDGFDNYMKIPTHVEEQDSYSQESIEKFAQSEFFKNQPSPFMKIVFKKEAYPNEAVVIKYSLFLPEEADRTRERCTEAEENRKVTDQIWHDHLIIHPYARKSLIEDCRAEEHVPAEFRKEKGYAQFPKNQYNCPKFCGAELGMYSKALSKLLNNEPVGLFAQKMFKPDYIHGSAPEGFGGRHSYDRVFKDIPLVLGHVSLEDIYSKFKVQAFPDFIANETGEWIPNPEKQLHFADEIITF